jgi:hypothetical protein
MIKNLLPRTAMLFRLESEEGERLLINVSEALIQYYLNKVYGNTNLEAMNAVARKNSCGLDNKINLFKV